MAHTTTNIHGVKSIRVIPVIFSTFVAHTVVFETAEGEITVSGFAPELLSVEIQPANLSAEASEAATA
jgi:hypothetical protein